MLELTWEKLVELEPRLLDLYHNILKRLNELDQFNDKHAHQLWSMHDGLFGQPGFKHQMQALVGWEADQDIELLTTEEAYEVAYRKLFNETIEPRIMDDTAEAA